MVDCCYAILPSSRRRPYISKLAGRARSFFVFNFQTFTSALLDTEDQEVLRGSRKTTVQLPSKMRMIVMSSAEISILVSAALIAGYALGRWSTKSKAASTASSRSSGAFALLVTLKFTSLNNRDTFLKLIEPVCNDVRSNEAEITLSYQVAISDKDPLNVLVMERYSDKDNAYLKVHKNGAEFLKYRDKLKSMQERGDVEIVGESYIETNLGYV